MILKTLKQDPKYILILDDEFIKYCELNKVEDVRKLAMETFNRGFTLLKYGETPIKKTIKIDEKKPEVKPIIKENKKDQLYDE